MAKVDPLQIVLDELREFRKDMRQGLDAVEAKTIEAHHRIDKWESKIGGAILVVSLLVSGIIWAAEMIIPRMFPVVAGIIAKVTH